MKIDRISYKKIFPMGSFQNETIGIEVQLEEGDNHDEVFEQAKDMVNWWGRNNIPSTQTATVNGVPATNIYTQPLPSIDYKAKETLERMIEDSNSVGELLALDQDKIDELGLRPFYDAMMKVFP